MKTQNTESRCYRTRKYTVCRHIHASFSLEILQAGAVKGLRVPGFLSITDIPERFPVNCEQRLLKRSSLFLVKDNSYYFLNIAATCFFHFRQLKKKIVGGGIASFTNVATNELSKLSEA